MTKKCIFSIFIIVFLYGCGQKAINNRSSEVIHINPNEAEEYVNLSEIVDSIKCIRLQTEPNDIIGKVREIIIRKKYIYVMDISQQTVFVFDREGKYVSKLDKHGDGPDEYTHMTAIFVDDNEEYIELINFRGSKTNKLKYTNITFELVETLPFSDFQYNSCKRDGDIYYFATQQLDNTVNGKQTNAGLIVVDEQNNIKTLFDKNIETNHNYFSVNMESFVKNDKNELFVSIMYDNSFYQLEDGEARPVFTVDFGKYGINNAFIGLKSTQKQMDYLKNAKQMAAIPVLNINNDNIMSFSYYFKQDIDNKGRTVCVARHCEGEA